ncbi:MAG: hypothetical protein LBT40_03940 [Deltaproteobacteria bacterium]|nr:hypothetical protein [Deltaproteobacteria bacterium]
MPTKTAPGILCLLAAAVLSHAALAQGTTGTDGNNAPSRDERSSAVSPSVSGPVEGSPGPAPGSASPAVSGDGEDASPGGSAADAGAASEGCEHGLLALGSRLAAEARESGSPIGLAAAAELIAGACKAVTSGNGARASTDRAPAATGLAPGNPAPDALSLFSEAAALARSASKEDLAAQIELAASSSRSGRAEDPALSSERGAASREGIGNSPYGRDSGVVEESQVLAADPRNCRQASCPGSRIAAQVFGPSPGLWDLPDPESYWDMTSSSSVLSSDTPASISRHMPPQGSVYGQNRGASAPDKDAAARISLALTVAHAGRAARSPMTVAAAAEIMSSPGVSSFCLVRKAAYRSPEPPTGSPDSTSEAPSSGTLSACESAGTVGTALFAEAGAIARDRHDVPLAGQIELAAGSAGVTVPPGTAAESR